MQVEIKVNGAVVRLIKRSLEINSTLGKRISTCKFDYLGEEKIVSPSVASIDANAYLGLTYPWGKDEIKVTGSDTLYLTSFFGGYVSTKEMRMVGDRRIYRILAQDYNILPTMQLVTKDFAAQNEQEMIDFLFLTYLPEIDYTTHVSSSGVTATLGWTRIPLTEVLDEIAKIYDREWYIDFDKKLHYFTPTVVGAPFELSSSPTPPAKVGYDHIFFEEDTSQVCNRVRVIGTGVNRERTSPTSIAYYGREFYCKVVDENIDTDAWGDSVGDAVLAERAFGKETGNLVCYQEGLVVGQKIRIYNFLRNIDDDYLIQGIRFNMLNKTTERITVRFGAYNKDLIALLGQIKGLEEKE